MAIPARGFLKEMEGEYGKMHIMRIYLIKELPFPFSWKKQRM